MGSLRCDGLRRGFLSLVTPTRSEAGCKRYELNQELDDSSVSGRQGWGVGSPSGFAAR